MILFLDVTIMTVDQEFEVERIGVGLSLSAPRVGEVPPFLFSLAH
jgi:hypothetical protein